MENDGYFYRGSSRLITRGKDFDSLYADTGISQTELKAPMSTGKVKFKEAIEQMGDDEMASIREFDRSRSGGFVNG
jgi:hypothetical protein